MTNATIELATGVLDVSRSNLQVQAKKNTDKRKIRYSKKDDELLHSDTRWCSDSFQIQCWNGDRVHVIFSLDTCDREVIRHLSSTIGVDGAMARDLMVESVEARFGQVTQLPVRVQWLSDNGPCYTARETVQTGRALGFEVCTTPSYSPKSNGMVEAFVKTFKRDYVWSADLTDARTVMAQLSKWFEDYNEKIILPSPLNLIDGDGALVFL